MAGATTPLPLLDDAAGERTTLTQFLDYQRTAFLRKTEGITDEEAGRAVAPSDLTLAKLTNHMAYVESFWANETFAGNDPEQPWAGASWADDPDWEMTSAVGQPIDELRVRFRSAWSGADAIYGGAPLDRLAVRAVGRNPAHRSLRWILVHLIEEYARHLGHADYLRQAIDGTVGD